MATLERAIAIAVEAHTGQLDKAGRPYILHPLRLMATFSDPRTQMAAVLHDVVEDCGAWSLERLAGEGFPPEVVSAMDALTKRDGESRIEAAHRAALDPIACAVKLADNADNSDLSRIPQPTERDHARLEEYRQVRAILLAAGRVMR